jgi:putative endonuclease
MYYVYVLKSISSGRFYKGFCSDLSIRLNEHNAGKTKSTKPFIPWKIVYFEEFESQYVAIRREKYFKSAAGRKFLSKHI